MDPIKITREQRNYLIDMCRELLQEYDNILWDKGLDYEKLWFGSNNKSKLDNTEWNWFELCVTELPRRIKITLSYIFEREEKIANNNIKEYNMIGENHLQYEPEILDGVDVLSLFLNNNIHPVDTLYKEFLKIKRWKAQ